MKLDKQDIIKRICRIREEIGHRNVNPGISDVMYDEENKVLLIVTPDRPEKSTVIGKGGWVVGKLKEELNINSIHVEAYPDILLKEYRIKLAGDKLNEISKASNLANFKPLINLSRILRLRLKNIYNFKYIQEDEKEEKDNKAVVALSGGVDSSFSLIVAKKMGFNPVAVTVDPGNIILPQYFKHNIEKLTGSLHVNHDYIEVGMDEIMQDSLQGRFHPCGRCSKVIKGMVSDYAKKADVPFLIYGDLLTTGSGSIVQEDGMIKINLPAMLSASKGEIKDIVSRYGIFPKGGYGCPLISEVHKKYPYMQRFSLQRILRETRAGILEPGEALEMIMSTIKE